MEHEEHKKKKIAELLSAKVRHGPDTGDGKQRGTEEKKDTLNTWL